MDLPYPYHRSLSPVDNTKPSLSLPVARNGEEDRDEEGTRIRLAESQSQDQNQNNRSMSSSSSSISMLAQAQGSEGEDDGEVPKTNDYNYNHTFDDRSAVSHQSLDVRSYSHSSRSSPSHTSASPMVYRQLFQRFRKLLPFKEILKKYLGNPEDSFDDSASIISEPLVLKPSNKMMRKLLALF